MDHDHYFRALDGDYGEHMGTERPRDTYIQIILSATLGVGAFLTFCVLRPRWTALYAARKRQKTEATALPELPNTLFGWIPALWRITDQQVLASAGLDAFVFLAFFKLAIKFLAVTSFFALVVIKPVHDEFPDATPQFHSNRTRHGHSNATKTFQESSVVPSGIERILGIADYNMDYLWMYTAFAYVFTGLATYLIVSETRRIIEIRQEYLGSQATVTDRTIRLSGIPPELRSEEKIKKFVEDLEIGQVESVMLCRKWKELDQLVAARMDTLRRLEEAWTVYLGHRRVERTLESLPIVQPPPPGPAVDEDGEEEEEEEGREHSHLLDSGDRSSHNVPYARTRPTTRVRYGRFKLRSKTVDAIDYYEEKMRKMDEQIKVLRKKEFDPTPLAFVTMDSVAACQMAIQAVLDPSPLQLLAKPSPAPANVVWTNTYLSRSSRMVRAWSITFSITMLTVFWSILLVPIATALNLESIHRVLPQLAEALERHPNAASLVRTQLPTLIISLLNVAVPYLYDWLANMQGMTSQGDVELSVIGKNFFFTFFNFFVVFTALGTASNFYQFFQNIGDSLKDTTKITYTLAVSLQRLLLFYVNFIILQGLGLFPFRLLEFGAVATYPIGLIGAKTPRDYAELVQPPVFSYGFYLPNAILIFIICIVYSVLRSSWMVLLAGLAHFVLGHFVYKYQLLYAMDHRQHSTGRSWLMICNRILLGIVVFQLTTAGQIALKGAVQGSFWPLLFMVPLLFMTLWFSYVYTRTYKPLMKFIALRSIRRAEHSDLGRALREGSDDYDAADARHGSETRHSETVDEARETGLRFINPSLVVPLEDVWITDKDARVEHHSDSFTNLNGEDEENVWAQESV